ncbi:MAG TPA: response regulator [Burkholderiaceae bacterium]|nr:response regulator [Burkholderiaceae bacterium]
MTEPREDVAYRDGSWILLVDDEPEVSTVYQAILQSEGYRVVRAAGGFEALCRLRAAAVAPRLILLDLRMPGVDGHEFHRQKSRLRAYADVPVVVVSGAVGRDGRTGDPVPPAADVKAVLPKPVPVDRLLATVAAWTR